MLTVPAPVFDPTVCSKFDRLSGSSAKTTLSLVKIHPLNAHDDLIQLPPCRFVIGRDSQADLWLDESSVSRAHACIEPAAGGFQVHDLGSTNGTYVNDERITSAALSAGDQLRFGNHVFKVLGSNDVEGQFLEAVYTRMIRDGLTGAYNKRYLTETLERDVQRSLRHQRPLTIAVMDIDHFKRVNDTYGHLIGDEVLREFSRRIAEVVRSEDILARYGGEEFVVVMNETTLDEGWVAAEAFRAAIAKIPFATSSAEIPVTVSVGLACVSDDVQTPTELISAADRKLYQAKREGRNRVEG